jgi:hypothetical protein
MRVAQVTVGTELMPPAATAAPSREDMKSAWASRDSHISTTSSRPSSTRCADMCDQAGRPVALAGGRIYAELSVDLLVLRFIHLVEFQDY